MVNLRLKKKLVARAFGVGVDRVWFDPENLDEIEGIETREDARRLVREGLIKILQVRGQTIREKRKRRGPGSRKGSKKARMPKKRLWIMRIRAQRKLLRELRDKGIINRSQYRKLYLMAKGGAFRSKVHLLEFVKTRLLSRGEEK